MLTLLVLGIQYLIPAVNPNGDTLNVIKYLLNIANYLTKDLVSVFQPMAENDPLYEEKTMIRSFFNSILRFFFTLFKVNKIYIATLKEPENDNCLGTLVSICVEQTLGNRKAAGVENDFYQLCFLACFVL